MIRSRLSRRTEQKTRKTFILSILGIIVIVLFALKFGIPLLVNMSLFISGSKNTQEQSKIQNPNFIPSPILNSLPEATSSADITISGVAMKNQTIALYINDTLVDETIIKDDENFSFDETISAGENVIKAKAVIKDKESEFSNPITIILKSAPPSLNVNFPANEQSFSKDQNIIEVNGTTDMDVKVTVNGFWAIVDDSGNFSYSLTLQNGENKITIIATDMAGNDNKEEIKVTYSP
jgi:bacillopeptidase F